MSLETLEGYFFRSKVSLRYKIVSLYSSFSSNASKLSEILLLPEFESANNILDLSAGFLIGLTGLVSLLNSCHS